MCQTHWTQYTRALRKAANGGAAGEADREGKPSRVPKATSTTQSQAATRVATKRAARVTATESDGATIQKTLLDKVRANGGSIPAEAPAPELTSKPGRRSKAANTEVAPE